MSVIVLSAAELVEDAAVPLLPPTTVTVVVLEPVTSVSVVNVSTEVVNVVVKMLSDVSFDSFHGCWDALALWVCNQ